MSETMPPQDGGPPQGGGTPQDDAANQQSAPRLSVLSQYIKDLSFENPRSPQQAAGSTARPEIQVTVDVKGQQISQDQFEVVIDLALNAKSGEQAVFVLELSYGGVFVMANIPQDSLQPLLLIECPRLLFPFARRIVADVSRDGGFPPLMLDPIDFVALYRRRAMQAQQAGGQPPSGTA
jgi:preprotein translocase subunit SecB